MKKPPDDLRKLPIVEVEWTDCTSTEDWLSWDKAMEFSPIRINTIGRLARKSKKNIGLITHVTSEGDVGSLTLIPRAWLHSIRSIRRRRR